MQAEEQGRTSRRRFLMAMATSGTGVAVGSSSLGMLASGAGAGAGTESEGVGVESGGPYGPLGEPDASGLRLPEGFSARVVATSGETVPDTDYSWHAAPDGGATFAMDDGGWVYVSNSETGFGDGGVGAIRFDAEGAVVDAYSILDGTARNCAGGATPWGTWLSCEEFDVFGNDEQIAKAGGYTGGRAWECDPTKPGQGEPRDAMGVFNHEGVAVDDVHEHLYLTEDHGDGLLYRFTPDEYPSLESGLLEAAVVADDSSVSWLPVPEPLATTAPTRKQVPGSTPFKGGEGIIFRDGHIYFSTKGDDHIWDLNTSEQRLTVVYDGSEDQPLHEVDNLTTPPNEVLDIYVAEDGDDLQVVIITEEGPLVPFLQAVGSLHEGSELTGPAFTPDGSRFYVSSQRGGERGVGITWEITGPFRSETTPPPTTGTTPGETSNPASTVPAVADSDDSGGGSSQAPLLGAGAAVAALAAALVALRTRSGKSKE